MRFVKIWQSCLKFYSICFMFYVLLHFLPWIHFQVFNLSVCPVQHSVMSGNVHIHNPLNKILTHYKGQCLPVALSPPWVGIYLFIFSILIPLDFIARQLIHLSPFLLCWDGYKYNSIFPVDYLNSGNDLNFLITYIGPFWTNVMHIL